MTLPDLLACGGVGAASAGLVVLVIAVWARVSGYSHVGLVSAERKAQGGPYRAPFVASGQEPTADPGEAWQAGVAAERARVLGLVRAVREASADSAVQRAADAIRAGVEGSAK